MVICNIKKMIIFIDSNLIYIRSYYSRFLYLNNFVLILLIPKYLNLLTRLVSSQNKSKIVANHNQSINKQKVDILSINSIVI